MGDRVLEVRDLGKRYRIGAGGYRTLRQALTPSGRRTEAADLWALRHVELTLDEGDVLGIVGPNGAGKSTLLKIIARITPPTEGSARMRGRVGAMLEVGTGFHPELTGRDNVFLNGVLIGMSRRSVAPRLEEIVEFAGVERFLDTPLKRYSTGMRLRLAFAISAHLMPEILVVDEVLATGDLEFRRKCLGKISEIGSQGRTILFVSHDLGAVGALCKRAMWLDRGTVKISGDARAVVDEYLRTGIERASAIEFEPDHGQPVQVLSVALADADGTVMSTPRRDAPIGLRLRLATRARVPGLDLSVYLANAQGTRVLDERWGDQPSWDEALGAPGEHDILLVIPPVLTSGDYVAGAWVGTELETFEYRDLVRFTVYPRPDDEQEAVERDRLLQPPVTWQVERAPEGT